jgi:hypothetical protein
MARPQVCGERGAKIGEVAMTRLSIIAAGVITLVIVFCSSFADPAEAIVVKDIDRCEFLYPSI